MTRFAISLIASILAFTAGLVTASSWSASDRKEVDPVAVNVNPCPPILNTPAPVLATEPVTPPRELDFAQGRLKLVSETVRLDSESQRYNVDVSYPQITGSEAPQIRTVNQHIFGEATKLYQWTVTPPNAYRAPGIGPGVYNTVNFTYDVNLATDSFLSLDFIGYSYGRGADYPIQRSFALNYDLKSGKALKLTDIFRPGSKYLEYISNYCVLQLSKKPAPLILEGVAPIAANFERWSITSHGITFYFGACKVMQCAEGEQNVQIPFSEVKGLLNPGVPGKFQITYP